MAFMTKPTDIQSANPEDGFQFPGVFELSAMGTAESTLATELPRLLEAAGVAVKHDDVTVRKSKAGNYVSVRIAFHARDRAQYDAAHEALRSHPEVKWTI